MMFDQFACGDLVSGFSRCEIAEQLASFDVGRSTRRCDIEFSSFTLHVRRFLTNSIKAEIPTNQIGRRE